ncbi:TPA: Tricalbin-2 [Trebouxia sp. C0004]
MSASSSGTNPSTPHHSGGRVITAASKLKHKLGFKSHKHYNEPLPVTSPAPPPVDTREAAGTSIGPVLPPAAPASANVAAQPTAYDSQPADFQWLCHRDIFVQVLHASKVRGADMGGSSDPVCKVSLGPFKARTRVLKHTLDPEWNETFIFVLEPDALAVMGSVPMLSFEVWDHNNFAPNYFLGEASCQLPAEVQHNKVTQQLQLHSNRHKAKSQSKGSLSFGVWLGPTGNTMGRMREGTMSGARTKLSTAVRPFGQPKTMPLVVHTGGNTLYEEPCLAYLRLHVTKVKGLHGDSLPQRSAISRVRSLRRSNSSSKITAPSNSRLARALQRSQHSMPVALQRHPNLALTESEEVQETLLTAFSEPYAAGEGDSPRSIDSPSGGDSQPSLFRQWYQGQEPWWAKDEEEQTQNAQSEIGESEADTDVNSTSPDGPHHSRSGRGRYYYLLVNMGNQKHTSPLKRCDEDGSLTWDLKIPLVAQVPIKNRIVKVELHCTSSRTKSGKLLATALIPLFQLMGFRQENEVHGPGRQRAEEGQWFRLHGQGKTASQTDAGIVKMALAVMDADVRRTMYQQPLLSQDKFTGSVPQYEKQAWQAEESGTAQPSLVQLTPLPEHITTSHARSPSEGVMSWLNDDATSQHSGLPAAHDPSVLDAGAHTPISPTGSSQHQEWPAYSSPTYVPQQTHDQRRGLLHTASLHAKAAAAATQECIQHAIRMATGVQTHEHELVRKPGVNVPAGMVKVTLHDVELMTPSLCFCVIKIGPHWGRTTTLMAAPKGSWDWEVHVPLYDPSSVMLLAVCSAQPTVHRARVLTRAVRSVLAQEDAVLGKLRIRLSTLQPWTEVEARLPMLADRDKGGSKVAYAHLTLKVLHWNQGVLLSEYIKPQFPADVYKYDMHHGDAAHKVAHEHDRTVAIWLEGVNPSISTPIAMGVVDTQRWRFTMSRARTNLRRLQNIRDHMAKYQTALHSLQRWERPPASLAAVTCTTLLCFYPHAVLACLLVYLMLHSLFTYRGVYQGEPMEMEAETEAEDTEEETELLSGNTNAVASLRRKYNKLLGVALTLQNLLDDVATQLERLQACITWQDPSATLLFIAFCACAAMALALLGLPTVMAIGCFWMVSVLPQRGMDFQLTRLSLHGLSCLKKFVQ